MLREGKVVAIPTETVYGLGANGLDEKAIGRIYEAKGRPSDNPLILHVPDKESLATLVKEITPTEHRLIDAFWPGPLTITMVKSDIVPFKVTGGLERAAFRCPDHAVCRAILKAAGVPIAAPSANISGKPSPTTAEAVFHDMKGRIEAIADAGPCQIGVESTVIECGDDEVTILRPGGITAEMMSQVVSKVRYDDHLVTGAGIPKAPGMKYKHYAPEAAMTTFLGSPEQIAARLTSVIERDIQQRERIGLLISEKTLALIPAAVRAKVQHSITYDSERQAESLAVILYEGLLAFDRDKVTRIYAEGVPSSDMGMAVMNRMDKASSHQIIDLGE